MIRVNGDSNEYKQVVYEERSLPKESLHQLLLPQLKVGKETSERGVFLSILDFCIFQIFFNLIVHVVGKFFITL